MIGHFPDPYPDELLYSVFARFSDRMDYPSKKSVVRDLFGTENVKAVVDLPSHLDSLIAALPPECSYTANDLIDNHTLLPFYGPFLPTERLKLVRRDMHSDRGTAIATRVGIVGSSIPLPRWLRFCPQCVEEDRQNWGECYWHRVHQVPSVFVCPAHANYLQQSDVPIRNARTKYEFISAECMLRTSAPQALTKLHSHDKVLLHIAEDIAWLLKQHQLTHGPVALQKKYLVVLAELGQLTSTGKVRVDDLIRSFKAYYTLGLLNQLHCNVADNKIDSWLTRLFRPSVVLQRAPHPIHHLLLIHFLGYQVKAFFNVREEAKPFGVGPWPCLNRASDHYRQPTILHCDVSYDPSTAGSVIGIFSCHCGFVYTRTGPDTSVEGQYRLNRVKSHGDIWNVVLRQLWEDPTVSLRDASVLLGTNKEALKEKAKLFGLSFPRPYEQLKPHQKTTLPKKTSSREKNLEVYRTLWISTLQESPEEPLQSLLTKPRLSSAYRWLSLHDSNWLAMHKPYLSLPRSLNLSNPYIDWNGRDARLAESVKESAQQLKNKPGRPMRVSVTAIGKDIDALALLQKHLHKLPLTSKVLSEVAETHEDCGVRRIWSTIALYQQECIIPTRQQLIRSSSVHNMLDSPNIKEALDEALRSFRALE